MPKATKIDRYDDVFPTRLRETLKEKKVTQAELGALLGCSNQSVSLYCNGNTQPKIEDIVKISQFLGVSVDYLFGLSDIRSTDPATKSLCKTLGLSENTINFLQSNQHAGKVVNFLSAQHDVALETLENFENGLCEDYVESIIELLHDFLLICDSQKDVLISLTSSYNITGEVVLDDVVKSIAFVSKEEPIKDEIGTVSLTRYIAMDKLQTIEAVLAEYLENKYFKNVFARKILLNRSNSEGNHEEP